MLVPAVRDAVDMNAMVGMPDGLIEAIWAQPCGANVLGVQWHPEWNVDHSPESRAFFALVGTSLRSSAAAFR